MSGTAIDALEIDDGGAICIDSPQGRYYAALVDGTLLKIRSSRVSQGNPASISYEVASCPSRVTTAKEAFEFFHGDYSPEKSFSCLGCGRTLDQGEACSCPVGVETDSVEWPEIPERDPRVYSGGQLYLVTGQSGELPKGITMS